MQSKTDWLRNVFFSYWYNIWGAFVWVVMPFELKNAPLTYQQAMNTTFKDYFGMFMKLFLDDFNMFNDMNTQLIKLQLCFAKCKKFSIRLNLEKCMFFMHSDIILGYVVRKASYQIKRKFWLLFTCLLKNT